MLFASDEKPDETHSSSRLAFDKPKKNEQLLWDQLNNRAYLSYRLQEWKETMKKKTRKEEKECGIIPSVPLSCWDVHIETSFLETK
jgi:hypothetical protein